MYQQDVSLAILDWFKAVVSSILDQATQMDTGSLKMGHRLLMCRDICFALVGSSRKNFKIKLITIKNMCLNTIEAGK